MRKTLIGYVVSGMALNPTTQVATHQPMFINISEAGSRDEAYGRAMRLIKEALPPSSGYIHHNIVMADAYIDDWFVRTLHSQLDAAA